MSNIMNIVAVCGRDTTTADVVGFLSHNDGWVPCQLRYAGRDAYGFYSVGEGVQRRFGAAIDHFDIIIVPEEAISRFFIWAGVELDIFWGGSEGRERVFFPSEKIHTYLKGGIKVDNLLLLFPE